MKKLSGITFVIVTAFMSALTGCRKPTQVDRAWTTPSPVSTSTAALGGWTDLYKWRDTIIGINIGTASGLMLNQDRNSWSEFPCTGVAQEYTWYPAVDPESERLLLPQGYAENERFVMKALIGAIAAQTGFRRVAEKNWITEKEALLGQTGPQVKMNQLGRRKWAGFGRGIWTGSEIYVPFSFDAETSFGINNSSNGPFVSAVFHSVDSGASWNLEKISSSDSTAPTMCKTTQNLYYFAGIYPLWASGKSTHGGIWEEPIIISETPGRVHSRFAVCADGDTAHICWMDRRHNKSRLIVDGSPVENDEIYYSRRKDSEGRWESAVRLSGGLLYSYAPSISAEGNKVVVAWAGIDTADGRHTYMSPNDIYFVTSKDAGATWTEPVKVTDDTKGGITAGMPQVFLLNGTIHLLFTQGKRSGTKEISPGSSKLGNEPWPIYYTQRPFPE